MTPKLLVLGGGFIGSHLIEEACKRKWRVTCASKSCPPIQGSGGKFIWKKLNVDNADEFEILGNEKPDYIVNLAGYVDHQSFFNGGLDVISTHFQGTVNSIKSLYHPDLKSYLYIGSSDEYGNHLAPQREDLREAPFTCYSFAKTASIQFLEMLSRSEKFHFSVVRPFLVYGPRQKTNRFLPYVIDACLRDKTFELSHCEQVRDFCFVKDLVNAIFLILQSPKAAGQIYNVGTGKPTQLRSVVEWIVRHIGKGTPIFGAIPSRLQENMTLFPDICKIQSDLGWRPATDFEVGIDETIRYMLRNGQY